MKTAILRTMYDKAADGLPILGTPGQTARRLGGTSGPLEKRSKGMVGLYMSLCGATGFACGLPGFLMLPVTVPTNLAGVAILQLHMTASIASLSGRSVETDETREECIACLLEKLTEDGVNSEEEEVVARTGIKFLERGARFTLGHVSSLSGRAARSVLLRRTGISRLPLIGGVIGAGSDAYMTRHVASVAFRRFESDLVPTPSE